MSMETKENNMFIAKIFFLETFTNEEYWILKTSIHCIKILVPNYIWLKSLKRKKKYMQRTKYRYLQAWTLMEAHLIKL